MKTIKIFITTMAGGISLLCGCACAAPIDMTFSLSPDDNQGGGYFFTATPTNAASQDAGIILGSVPAGAVSFTFDSTNLPGPACFIYGCYTNVYQTTVDGVVTQWMVFSPFSNPLYIGPVVTNTVTITNIVVVTNTVIVPLPPWHPPGPPLPKPRPK